MFDTSTNTHTVYHASSDAQSRRQAANVEAQKKQRKLQAGMKPMCTSQADAAGAKMSTASPMPTVTATP